MSQSRFGLVFPVIPPVPNGIGDYTACLAATLAESDSCIVVTEAGMFEPIDGVEILSCTGDFSSAGGLSDILEDRDIDYLIVQYNPFSYGRWGLNLRFPETLRRVKKRNPSIQIGLMVHEAFVPFESLKQAVMTTWQRYQLVRLAGVADILFFSISPWVRRFQKWFPNKTVLHAPVGSNIPRRGVDRAQARKELGISDNTVVVGAFGSDHESRKWDWVVDAAEAIAAANDDTLFLYAGSAGELLRKMIRNVDYRSLDRLPSDELSTAISAMDIFLTPFRKGISSRKGSAIIALQHGIATLTSHGPQTDQLFVDAGLDLIDCKDKEAFVEQALRVSEDREYRRALAQNGLELYNRVFRWDVVADVFRSAFES